ncbi:ABC transporter permease [Roseivirga sp.]|uniref:ABC transporter permease n=1 Tax=Roseivirga sp. TaxID=1964215 RepID=UPI002B26ED84|nr:ABC transporter permease [Roseivirga sp.]
MFENFFKVTVRSLLKSKLFVFINIVGLGLALACCIVAFLNYEFATTFDKQHTNYDELYQVSVRIDQNGSQVPFGFAPMPLGTVIKSEIPSIERASRFERAGVTIKRDNNVFNRTMAFVDQDFMEMFTFPMLYGSAESYHELSTVLISDRAAIALFGRENAVGETIELVLTGKPNILLTVGGVFEEPGLKSTLQFQLVADFENFYRNFNVKKDDWSQFTDGLFIQSKDPAIVETAPALLQKYAAVQAEVKKDLPASGFWVQTMDEIAFNGRDLNGTNLGNEALHPAHILVPNIMAVLILLLACFNFTNTAIAMSNRRLKEIGIRKTVGGSRAQLVIQFLGENLVLCFLALLLGLLFSLWLVPKYSDMWPNMDVYLSLRNNPGMIIFLISSLVLTALLAGGYPAIFVSRFRPVAILRGNLKVGSSSILSKVLLGFQMLISVMALVFGFAFVQNSNFQEGLDLGYDREGILMVPLNNSNEAERFRAAVQTNPLIQESALTNGHVGWSSYQRPVKTEGNEGQVTILDIGLNYMETMGLKVVDGRSFTSENQETDKQSGIVINQKMASRFGWEEPIGQQITMNDSLRYTVVGMVKDFYTFGLWAPIEPMILRLRDDKDLSMLITKVDPKKAGATMDYLESTWSEVIKDRPARVYSHEINVLGEARDVNKNIVTMFLFLALIAVVLSAIGLFTLVSINIQSRTKEIGIRKVLGASIARITTLINKPFLIIVGIASVLGGAVSVYFAGMLMGSIWTYHVTPGLISALIPILTIQLIALLSISGKVIKTAKRNPVESLRYE